MKHLPFLRMIADNPDDDGPRLVYADFLEETGECDSAEFIKLGIELAGYVEELPVVETQLSLYFEGGEQLASNYRMQFGTMDEAIAATTKFLHYEVELVNAKRERLRRFVCTQALPTPIHFRDESGNFKTTHQLNLTFVSRGRVEVVTLPTMPSAEWRAKQMRLQFLRDPFLWNTLCRTVMPPPLVFASLESFERGFPTVMNVERPSLIRNFEPYLDAVLENLPITQVRVGGFDIDITKQESSWQICIGLPNNERSPSIAYSVNGRSELGSGIRSLLARVDHATGCVRPGEHETSFFDTVSWDVRIPFTHVETPAQNITFGLAESGE